MQQKKKDVKLMVECPSCHRLVDLATEFTADPLMFAPKTRGEIDPVENILVYKFTSEDLKKFITDKTHGYTPNAQVEVVPLYCEKKHQRPGDIHRSYASLRIGFSTDILERNNEAGWYGQIGESSSNVAIIKDVKTNLIKLYQYNPKVVDKWLESYKTLETLEDCLGMTEAYIHEIKQYIIPKRITATNNKQWILFSAETEKVIKDFLTDEETDLLPGKMKIVDIYPIMKGVVQFIVHIYPHEVESKEDPVVRKIMLGEEKPKK